jgi:hypothetical protein
MNKKAFILLPLLLLATTATQSWDKKDKALVIGAVSTLVGGELIKQAILHKTKLYDIMKDRPHVLFAGTAVGIIAVRQYHSVVIQPIIDWYKGTPNKN